MDATTVAIDLAKDVFPVAVANRARRVLDRQRFTRRQFERFVDTLGQDTEVIMESCGTSHYWGRRLQARGLRVRLLPVQYVRPYVRRNKTDRADTDALRRDSSRASEDRRAANAPGDSCVRTQWQTARVARINAMRGLLAEHGQTTPTGARTVLRRVTVIITDPDVALPDVLRHTIAFVVEEVPGLEEKIAGLDRQLATHRGRHKATVAVANKLASRCTAESRMA